MPLEIMDQSSSPHLLEEIYFPSEALILQPQLKCYRRQLGFWMPNILPDHQGMVQTPVRKSDASSHLEDVLPNGAVSVDCSKLPPSHVDSVQKQKCYSDEQETAKFSGASLGYVNDNPRTWANLYLHPVSNSMDAKRTNVNGIHEHCLFSSSMSENFTRKLRLSANDSLPHWYADTAAFCNDVEEPFVSDKQIDGQTIGKFLPDEDDLFSGMIDELRYSAHANGSNDEEDFDMFSSGGGMELGGENHLYVCQGNSYSTAGIINGQGSSNGLPASEHPYGEHPSRTLFVRNIYSNVEDSELRILFEQFGDIRTMYTASKHRGFVMISYYDIRAAWNAMSALQNKPLGCRKLDIHYSIPKDYLSEKDINQGTLKVFNLDSMVSSDELHQIFGCFGEIKEIRKTSDKHNHKFIEYYDIRAAETALHALDRSDISGKWIKLELSHQGGAKQCLVHQRSPELLQDELSLCRSPNDKAASDCMVFGSSGIGSCALHRHCHVWSNPKSFQHNPPSPMIWPNSPPYVNNTDCTRKLNGFSRVPPHVLKLNIVSPTHQHHIGSAPAVNPSHWDRQRSYNGESPNAIGFHLDSLGSVGFPTSSPLHLSDVASQNIFSHIGGNFMDMSANYALSSRRHISHIFPARNAVTSTPTSFGTPTMRNLLYRKNKADSFHAEKKKYVLDIDRVLRREDIRTTLMIKNIPNKLRIGLGPLVIHMSFFISNAYTSKMLLAAIDEQQHRGTYDFIYLPIDFKNKCNVGYAFINMSDPLQIIPFHKAFNGKKWEKFNSEKVAYLTYARIQGKAALIAHFQNSSLMNEDKRCRPILFCIDGPNAGEQEPFPMGTTIHPKNYKQGSASILLKEKNLPTKQTFHQAVNPRNQL